MKTQARLWVKGLRPGDIVLCLDQKSLFAKIQNLYRRKITRAKHNASHGFIVTNPPLISEAQGNTVHADTIDKYLTKHHTIWVFRYRGLRNDQLRRMEAFIDGSEQSGGTYAWGGIFQFVKKFFFRKSKIKDKRGVFCIEYLARAIITGGLPFIHEKKPWELTPSMVLSWFMDLGMPRGWEIVKFFDGGLYSR